VDACDDAEGPRVALAVGADVAYGPALADVGDVPAALAGAELVAQRGQLGAELARDRFVGGEEPEDEALRGLLADAGEPREELADAADLRGHGARPVAAFIRSRLHKARRGRGS
jgi:hypothetical protein